MLGDWHDMARRMRLVLPRNWFGDTTPVLDAVLGGLGTAMAAAYALLQAVIQQSRLLTSSQNFIDSFAADFFGQGLLRWAGEADDSYRERVRQELLRSRDTRAAILQALRELTGNLPILFEPARTEDTGGYSTGGIGYGSAGGWGSLALPFQFFVSVIRPPQSAIALLAGYGTGGFSFYGSLAMETSSPTDTVLMAAIPPLLPAASIAWCRLQG